MPSNAPAHSAAADLPRAVQWDGRLRLLDQRALPGAVEFITISTLAEAVAAIANLSVRGAPAIGITAAYGLVVALESHRAATDEAFERALQTAADALVGARPTAVNLAWAVGRCCHATRAATGADQKFLALLGQAQAIHAEDEAICAGIGQAGVDLIFPGCGIMTHCNAGALAVSTLGTATAPMYLAHERGVPFRVFANETRPVLQGARLTAWELQRAGLDVTLLCDNMAAQLMASGSIDLVIVGTDRVTANGDVVNKIGTLGVAVLAHHYNIPFYVACPSSTFDAATASGAQVTIEERPREEVTAIAGQTIAPEGIQVINPAFDVTPAALVSGIITERGIARAPLASTLAELLSAP